MGGEGIAAMNPSLSANTVTALAAVRPLICYFEDGEVRTRSGIWENFADRAALPLLRPLLVSISVGGRNILVETGLLGRQASGSVTVSDGAVIRPLASAGTPDLLRTHPDLPWTQLRKGKKPISEEVHLTAATEGFHVEYYNEGERRVTLPLPSAPWGRSADPGRILDGKIVDLEKGKSRDLGSRCYETPTFSAAQQIFIRSTEGRDFCLQIWGSMRVLELKQKIQDKMGIPVALQSLIFSGICMQEHQTLQHYRVVKDSTIILNHRLRGGSKGSTSKYTGTYRDAAKGKEPPKGKDPAAANLLPGQYIVDQMPESPSISLEIPEVRCIFSDLEKNAVICRFNGFWPRTEALYQWIYTAWTKNCQIHLCSKGFFIVVFQVDEEKEKILSEGPWFWGSAGLFVTPWFQEFNANTMVVSRMPVWVRLHNLPMHFWHFKTLSAIGNTLGRMLKIDTDRHIKGIFTFARICVEVDLSQGLPENIILNFNNIQWKQPLDYENTAFRCRGCQQTGHLLNACLSKSKTQQRKHKGWQNLDEVLKRRLARKKAPSVTEEEKTEAEEDDNIIEEVEIENQKENRADNKDPQPHTNQAETQQNNAETTSGDQSMGGNKRHHHSDTSDSDKESGQQNETTQLVIASIEPTLGEWRKVEKKKGRKT